MTNNNKVAKEDILNILELHTSGKIQLDDYHFHLLKVAYHDELTTSQTLTLEKVINQYKDIV